MHRTPLHYASANGHLDIVKYIMEEEHCDPYTVDEKFSTALSLASKKGHFDIVKYLISDKQIQFTMQLTKVE